MKIIRTLQATVRQWIELHPANPQVGGYRTSVFIFGPAGTFGATLGGKYLRKHALRVVWDRCNREREKYSQAFFDQLRDLIDGRKKVQS